MTRNRPIIVFSTFLVLGIASLVVYLSLWPSLTVSDACPNPIKANDTYIATDTEGHTFTAQNLLGSPTLLFFGFTYCPEVCPTTMNDISRWLESLGKDADKIKVVFVTVDPERDTPDQLKNYLNSFDKRIHGIVPTPCNLAIIAKNYNIFYEKVQLEHGEYGMDHDANILLLDDNGHMVGTLNYQESDEIAHVKLEKLVALEK